MDRIVIISPAPPYKGGIADSTFNLQKHLSKKYSVNVITFSKLYPKIIFPSTNQETSSKTTDHNTFRIINSMNPFTWRASANKIIDIAPQLVLIRYWNPFFSFCYKIIIKQIRKKLNNAVIIGICDNILPHENIILQKYFARMFISNLDAVITMSEKVQQDLDNIMPGTISSRLYHPVFDIHDKRISKKDAKAKLSINDNLKVVLFFGFIRKYKGFDTFINIANLIEKRRSDILFLAAGELYERTNEYEKFIGDSKNIIWHNRYIPNDKVHEYFSAADMLLMPYKNITQSGVASLSFSFSCPVMISNVGTVNEIIDNGVNGIIVDSQLPEVFVEEIINAIDSDILENISDNLKKNPDILGWTDFTDGVLEIYEKSKS